MNTKREEKALFEFKRIMENLMLLLAKSTAAKTGYLYWVNRSREQFVLETKYTILQNVMFQDRLNFHKSYLEKFKDIDHEVQLELGKDISRSELKHYYNQSPVHHCLLIPFINNGETVAITVLESEEKIDLSEYQNVLSAYKSAHSNVLNTYLELTDLYEDQHKWTEFDKSLSLFSSSLSPVENLDLLIREMQKLLPGGGVTAVIRGMETWVSALTPPQSQAAPSVGLMVEEKSMAYDALQKGEPVFSMHFNQNPKRITSGEKGTDGATFAIPLMISSKRHAVLLACNPNPLLFTDSLKHQLYTLTTLASLSIEAAGKEGNVRNLFTTEYGNFTSEVWEKAVEYEISRTPKRDSQVWFGLVGIENLSEIRSRFRLEELKKLQRLLVKALNPSRLGYKGIIGFHSDYVYSYLFFSNSENHHDEWLNRTINDCKTRLDMGDEREVSVEITAGSVKLDTLDISVDSAVADAKKALGIALNQNKRTVSL